MKKLNSKEWLFFERTVRFGETDAAGVIHFYQLLRWCHEAWEDSLQKYGIFLKDIFPTNEINKEQPDLALPVVHCEAKYFKPLYVGDVINIELEPKKIDEYSFVLRFNFKRGIDHIGIGNMKHISINRVTREKCLLSNPIKLWLEDSL